MAIDKKSVYLPDKIPAETRNIMYKYQHDEGNLQKVHANIILSEKVQSKPMKSRNKTVSTYQFNIVLQIIAIDN